MAKLGLYRLMLLMIGGFLAIGAAAQLQLKIQQVSESGSPVSLPPMKTTFKSRGEIDHYLEKIPAMLQAKGYLSASVDSVAVNGTVVTAYLHTGEKYSWAELRIDPENWPLLNTLGFSASSFAIADPATISALPQAIIGYYQNNGHPFAKVKWDSIKLRANSISARLRVDAGPLYKLDSIGIYGTAKISKSFLLQYLGIPADGVYHQEIFDRIDQKLLELPYLEQTQPWNISMHTTGYVINFYFRPKKTNQVDALVGLLPSNEQNGGKFLLTADAKIILKNAFGGGETVDFNWEQIQPKSPRLFLFFQQPYIFRSAFGFTAGFELYKKDSTFLNIEGHLGLQYAFGRHESFNILVRSQRTNLLDVDTNAVKMTRRLPDIVDLTTVSLAAEYVYSKTDYRFNPRRGTELLLAASAGRKVIRQNNAITQIRDHSFDYRSLYDSLRRNSHQLRLRLNAAQFFPLAKRATIKASVQAGWLETPNYFRNEMFQLGGYRLLRGFDEESIFANRFVVTGVEYRYLVDLNSYFFGFADAGWSAFKSQSVAFDHTYLGLGAGMAFQLKQGIFNISYAVGKRDDTRINLRQSKIHFGYTSFF
jgi:outer membrane protein assembly factor BamA